MNEVSYGRGIILKKCMKCTYDNEELALFCIRCGAKLENADKAYDRHNDNIFHDEPLHLEEDMTTYLEKYGNRPIYTQEYKEDDMDKLADYVKSSEEIFGRQNNDGGMGLKKCTYCGAYNTSDIKSCCSCGALLQRSDRKSGNNASEPTKQSYSDNSSETKPSVLHQVEVKQVKKTGSLVKYIQSLKENKRYIVILSVAVILVMGLILGINSFTANVGITFYDNGAMDYIWEETGGSFFTNEKAVAHIEDKIEDVIFSMDRTKAVVLTEMPSPKIGGDLYLIEDNKKIKLLDYGVVNAAFASGGNGVAYFKDYDETERTANLYYSYAGKKPVIIEEDVPIIIADMGLTISPDGNSVGYYAYDGKNGAGYISTKGKQGKLFGENRKIIALSDKGEYVYYVKEDQKGKSKLDNLYVKHYNLDTKLYGVDDYVNDIFFNQDYSEIMVVHDDGTFLSVKGKDKEKLMNESLYLIVPRLTQIRVEENYVICGIKNFEDKVYYGEDILYYLSDSRLEPMGDNVSRAVISKDLKTLVYQDSEGDLFWTKDIKESNPKMNKINVDGSLVDFVVTDHGDYIYYVNRDGDLYQMHPGKEEKRVSGEAAYLQLSGDTLYFLYDYGSDNLISYMQSNLTLKSKSSGILCYIKDGERMTISEGDGVQYMNVLGDGIIYFQGTNIENSLWGVSKKQKKTLLLENVSTYH